MATLDPIPQARVVRTAGQLCAPPPEPTRPPGPLARMAAEQLRTALSVAIGLWPLTAVVLAMTGLVILAGHYQAP